MTPAQLLVKGTVVSVVDNTGGVSGGLKAGKIPISLGRDGAAVMLTVQVIDAQTGCVAAADDVVGKAHKSRLGLSSLPLGGSIQISKNDMVAKACQDALEKAIDVVAQGLEKVPWQGTVVDASSGEVLINRGEREGVPVGQQFLVGDAERILDPDTGEFLDFSFDEVGRLEVTKVRNRTATCKVLSSVKSVAKGMTIVIPE